MRFDWKIKFGLVVFALVGIVATVIMFRIPADSTEVIQNISSEVQEYVPEAADVSTREGFIAEIIGIYETVTKKAVDTTKSDISFDGENENLAKAAVLGLIGNSDKSFYSEGEGVSASFAAQIVYRAMTLIDPAFEINADEAAHILNSEYNNAVLEDADRIPYAFMLKHGIFPDNFVKNPHLPVSADDAQLALTKVRRVFCPEIEFKMGQNAVVMGVSDDALIAAFGAPNRIDITALGFEWYVYNSDYNRFMMVGVDEGVVCAFFSNAGKFKYKDIKSGSSMLAAQEAVNENFSLYENEQTGLLDAIYYHAGAHEGVSDEKMRILQGRQLLDMINAARIKQKLSVFLNDSDLAHKALGNSKHLASGNDEWGVGGEVTHLYGKDLFACYEEMLSLRHESVWTYSPKMTANGGIGVWSDGEKLYVTMAADDTGRLSGAAPEQVVPEDKKYPDITPGTASISSPLDGTRIAADEGLLFVFGGEGAEKYHIDILNCETRDYVVNTDITGDLTDYRVSADRFENGVDYEVYVTAYYGGAAVLEHSALVECGEAEEVEILSPTAEHILTKSDISIMWRSSMYTDFQIDIFDAKNELTASSRVIDATKTDVSGLATGEYMLRVSAMRRDTNIVKTFSETPFKITEEQQPQIVAAPVKKPVFTTNRYSAVFGNSLAVYTSKAEADANMVTVKIPVWNIKADGTKVATTANLTVNRAIANEVVAIFTEIFSGPERFPIKSVGGYNWRNTATGGKSHHSYGTAIDINPTENYCIYNTGKRIGSYWLPGKDPYSMSADGDVVRVFKKYGWTWGGEWNSLKDYMHFSYLGG